MTTLHYFRSSPSGIWSEVQYADIVAGNIVIAITEDHPPNAVQQVDMWKVTDAGSWMRYIPT